MSEEKATLQHYLQGARDTLAWKVEHAGHADILREQVDGSAGLLRHVSKLPTSIDWAASTARLTAIADRSPD
ncbi:hypothetical protein [Nocardioides sp.]|uniref:hypothetical protein n=1 Tax=Nocardioides sp. TaxID=35761 RepID=UPI003517E2DB